jgi:hypothetical protein
MKKVIILGILMAMAITVSAEPQKTKGFRTTVTRTKTVKTEKPAPVRRSEVDGVIPRAVRGGNPLQMLNPMAPARYGTGEQSVAYNPISGKYDQITLLEISF